MKRKNQEKKNGRQSETPFHDRLRVPAPDIDPPDLQRKLHNHIFNRVSGLVNIHDEEEAAGSDFPAGAPKSGTRVPTGEKESANGTRVPTGEKGPAK